MDEYSSVDTITPTIGGFWIGVIGAVVGVAGLGFSIYSSVEKEPNVRLLILSGWTAALLASVTAGIIAFRLVKLISGMSQKIAALSSRISELQADNQKLVSIDAYIISSTTRRAKPRTIFAAQARTPEPAPIR